VAVAASGVQAPVLALHHVLVLARAFGPVPERAHSYRR
jgi:hypothetical protein